MVEWTREQRYRRLEDVEQDEVIELKKIVDSCPYRQQFHIQPETGLLNDPNGFSYYNGEYHLFYQWFPLGPVHGLKYWYHISSKNLVNWKDCGVGITPDKYFESHGAFSGTGIVQKEKLYLFYTGNTRDKDWVRHPYQCLAVMDKKGIITKNNEPIIESVPEGYTDHFRDPKVFKNNDKYYCLIGAQTDELKGTIVYYQSENLLNWNYQGEIKTSFKGNGFMWECPDYFEVGGKGVLILSPQGMEPQGDSYRNIFQSGYLIGEKMDLENGTFNHGEFRELDRGFDFYAPQTIEDNNGRRILIAWMGLPEIDYPSDENGWAHCLTIPRELKIKDHKILQIPVKELELLRGREHSVSYKLNNEDRDVDGFNGKTYELICKFKELSGDYAGVKLRKGENEELSVYYDIKDKKVVFDRSKSENLFAQEYGLQRKCNIDSREIKLQIFADVSSVEIFVNDGEEVFTGRIFTDKNSTGISFFAEGQAKVEAKIWEI
ncbi:MAG: sucrose-6-phosphate hydrolase [Clostridiaceae bacterium]